MVATFHPEAEVIKQFYDRARGQDVKVKLMSFIHRNDVHTAVQSLVFRASADCLARTYPADIRNRAFMLFWTNDSNLLFKTNR
jgi:hypothetical protein